MNKEKTDIKSLNLERLTEKIKEFGEKPFRAKQIYDWIHVKLAADFSEMTNISLKLRERLSEEFYLERFKILRLQVSKQDGTRKYLFGLRDGNAIESVLMPYKHGNSICVSSQVGCRMGCRFCASTVDGLVRSLETGEMLEQVYAVSKDIGERISNIVIMGSGEPLDNYDNVTEFIRMAQAEAGLDISQRNITLSTCGLVPNMYRLAEEGLKITLALSLHGVSDEKRSELMPVAKRYSLDEVLPACRNYFEKTGRRVTLEYSLISGENDTYEDAKGLIRIAKSIEAHVNLIPVNPISERKYRGTGRNEAIAFKNMLEKKKINATIRREMGRDIDGACGQLRRRYMNESRDKWT